MSVGLQQASSELIRRHRNAVYQYMYMFLYVYPRGIGIVYSRYILLYSKRTFKT